METTLLCYFYPSSLLTNPSFYARNEACSSAPRYCNSPARGRLWGGEDVGCTVHPLVQLLHCAPWGQLVQAGTLLTGRESEYRQWDPLLHSACAANTLLGARPDHTHHHPCSITPTHKHAYTYIITHRDLLLIADMCEYFFQDTNLALNYYRSNKLSLTIYILHRHETWEEW